MASRTKDRAARAAALSQLAHDAATWGLLAVLVGTTSAFGGVETAARAWLLFGGLVCVTLAAWTSRRSDVTRPILAVALPIAAIVLWGLIQVTPLPRPVLEIVSPKAAALYDATVPRRGSTALPAFLSAQAVKEGARLRDGVIVPDGSPVDSGFGVGRTISIAPADTLAACRSWLSAGLLFFAAALLAREPYRRSLILWGVAVWGGILGILALIQRIVGTDWFLGSRAIPPDSDPLGPFINPNHFGAYVGVCALVSFGLALAHIGRPSDGLSWKSVRAAFVDTQWALPRLLALAVLTSASVTGLALSRSRGAWLALIVGVAVVASTRRRRTIVAGVLVAIAVLGIVAGVASWVARGNASSIAPYVSHQRDASAVERLDAWARTVSLFGDHVVAGTGLGTFEWAFARYQRLGEWMNWGQAHNEYLQFLAEAGAVGGFLLFLGLILFVRRVLLSALTRAGGGPRWTTVGIAAVVVATAVHSVVEFDLQIPALAALVATLVGVLAAAAADPASEEAA